MHIHSDRLASFLEMAHELTQDNPWIAVGGVAMGALIGIDAAVDLATNDVSLSLGLARGAAGVALSGASAVGFIVKAD